MRRSERMAQFSHPMAIKPKRGLFARANYFYTLVTKYSFDTIRY